MNKTEGANEMTKHIREMLLAMSDRQVDPIVKDLARAWGDPVTPLELLKAIDMTIHGSLTSSFELSAMQIAYDMLCQASNTTHDEVARSATWRTEWATP